MCNCPSRLLETPQRSIFSTEKTTVVAQGPQPDLLMLIPIPDFTPHVPCLHLQLTMRAIDVGIARPQQVQCTMHELEASSQFLEYIPGRDQLWPPPALAAGDFLEWHYPWLTADHMPFAIGGKFAFAMLEGLQSPHA